MKFFNASFASIVIRFYLMMAVVILAVLVGPIWLAALALPLFLSALLGPTLRPVRKTQVKKSVPNFVSLTTA